MLSAEAFRAIVSGEKRGPAAGLTRSLLALAELPYALAMRIRNRHFNQGSATVKQVEVPVISIGNLTLGGTGKTPMVGWIARWFRQQGVRVSIVSRGYGAESNSSNDEAKELEARLPDVPHLQNPERYRAARIAIDELDTQLILLDDGFQHRRLHRDLDLVLIDATEPFGYEHVFPRGMLREPLSGLQRADAIILTRCNLVDKAQIATIRAQAMRLAPQAKWIEVGHEATELRSSSGKCTPLTELAGKSVIAFCGIGNPTAFRDTLEAHQLMISDFRMFPDHHTYSREDIRNLADWSQHASPHQAVICTHKDLVKISTDRLGQQPLYALLIDLKIQHGGEQLEHLLHASLPSEER
ncbi:MAG: tetraacyldisaccharide 4'-kinase [Planctomycetaceae bacterium]|nr:tetraacyldisaccharide 4'-kinase [Planctomycetaceae bacterium]